MDASFFFPSFLLILVFILLHIGILLAVTYYGWMGVFFVTVVIILLDARTDWEDKYKSRSDYVKVEENPMFRPP